MLQHQPMSRRFNWLLAIPLVASMLFTSQPVIRPAVAGADTLTTTSGTTYYVDSTLGNDQSIGTSINQPWKTLAKVSQQSFQPGDHILLKRDDVWHEQLTVPTSGSTTAPITFAAYGTGTDPVITGSDPVTTWQLDTAPSIYRASVSWKPKEVLFSNHLGTVASSKTALTADKQWFYDTSARQLYIFSSTAPANVEAARRESAIVLTDESHLILDHLRLLNTNSSSEGAGLKILATTAQSDIRLTNLVLNNNHAFGLIAQTQNSGTLDALSLESITGSHNGLMGTNSGAIELRGSGGPISHITVTRMHLSYSGIDETGGVYGVFGINLRHVNSATITATEIDHTSSSGLDIETGSMNVSVIGGSYHDNGFITGGDDDGIGIGGLGKGSSNITIDGADVFNNHNANIEVSSTDVPGEVMSNIIVKHSRLHGGIRGCGLQVSGAGHSVIAFANLVYHNPNHGIYSLGGPTTGSSLTVYNNTITQNAHTGLLIGKGSAVVTNNIISNNATAWGYEIERDLKVTRYVGDYNLIHHAAGGTKYLYWAGKGEMPFSQWVAMTGQDSHSLNTDPFFTSPLTSDYSLRADSPAASAGTRLSQLYASLLKSGAAWPDQITTQDQPADKWILGAFATASTRRPPQSRG